LKYIVIGISNNPRFVFSEELMTLLNTHAIFSGGKRHYALVKSRLPANHRWIDIAGGMPALFDAYRQLNQTIVVFASGDPLFYGFANTIKKYHAGAELHVYPHANSLQLLCQKSGIPYQNMVNTSVHGRSWDELDTAMIRQPALIGVLTDAVKTPAAIAQRLLDYNFHQYSMLVGEALEGAEEKISRLSLEECASRVFNELNCVLLIREKQKQKSFGIPDHAFTGLENRPNMITKMPVRLVSLAQLDLHNRKILWDIGFCTGSVSIEAKTQFPQLKVIAFEKREECSDIFDVNTRRHSTPGLTKVMGDFFEAALQAMPAPDAVFIGGHGNRLDALMQLVDQYLLPGGRLVMNAVQENSKASFLTSAEALNYQVLAPVEMSVNDHNPITILTAEKRTA